MRCKHCNYRLWNLPAGECPECGGSFKPSDFTFVPNAVRFGCPSCEQTYYGDGERGHLRPIEFSCVSCGDRIHMDDTLLQPSKSVHEQNTVTDDMPWLHRGESEKRFGRFRAWMKTRNTAFATPAKLIRLTPPSSSVGSAFWFGTVTQAAYLGIGFGVMVGFFAFLTLSSGGINVLLNDVLPQVGVYLVFGAALVCAMALWTVFTHALLRLTGGCEHGMGRTMHAMCYSSVANVPLVLPVCGMFFMPLACMWWSIYAILMLRVAQGISGWRASFAVLTPVALLVLLLVVLDVLNEFSFLF